jgi:hypothetical protein
MEFLNHLYRNDYKNAPIEFGHNVFLSIQANNECDCIPKKNLSKNKDYEAFEVSLYMQDTKNPLSIAIFTELTQPPLVEDEKKNWACLNVPASQVEEIFQIIKSKFKLKEK